MQTTKAVWLPLLLVATALAGCAGGGGGCADICVDAPTDGSKTYTFRAGVTADNYTWDFGDNSAPAYGAEATHTYDLANGKVTPKLFAVAGGEKRRYDGETITFGSGNNEKATFLFEAQTKWHIVGEPVRFSASLSHDPDGDVLRYSWACVRVKDAVTVPFHPHNGLPPPFASPPAGSVTAGVTNRTLPEPTLVLDAGSDMCEVLGGLGNQPMSPSAVTIEGRFQRSGIYKVFLLAADPAHPAVSGEWEFVVSETRPAPKSTWTFAGKFNVSNPGSPVPVQQACDLVADSGGPAAVCDIWRQSWEMPVVGATDSWVNFTILDTPDVNMAQWFWKSSGGDLIESGSTGTTYVSSLKTQGPRAYVMEVQAKQGAQFSFRLTVESKMDIDANKIYF